MTKQYDFESMGSIWANRAREITEKGVFIAHSGNWDMWEYQEILYSIPVCDSGCRASVWCKMSRLREHLLRLKHICRSDSLIPISWKNVNYKYLEKYGVKEISE